MVNVNTKLVSFVLFLILLLFGIILLIIGLIQKNDSVVFWITVVAILVIGGLGVVLFGLYVASNWEALTVTTPKETLLTSEEIKKNW